VCDVSAWFALRELAAAIRRFDEFVRELARLIVDDECDAWHLTLPAQVTRSGYPVRLPGQVTRSGYSLRLLPD
jgi:hypothetical protein